ncbi:uncharacterized protein LOC141884771 isoform X2 [Acropora palmata]|uniref:uncharacterized protein LOC141884771 isoform X2 n=1 Tax=Acropora palmata TaxID=6131 RepID=UPI003DA1708E
MELKTAFVIFVLLAAIIEFSSVCRGQDDFLCLFHKCTKREEMDDSPIPASSPESGEASQQSDRSEKRLMRLAEFLQKKRNQFKVDDSMARN